MDANTVLRDVIYQPYPIINRNSTHLKYISEIGDNQPWIAIDLASQRNITSVQIAQFYETAVTGEIPTHLDLPRPKNVSELSIAKLSKID